ncbi:CGNR zinc finger domain-containing protein [Pseudonocardia acaciae]|uniref:CGNR zinc finger domain-containing protein n=1 Tax=Pseudonocardia acaciae TaxID=551276 RepID=UPI00048CDBEF|nr:ABATE domain-containing protein [Pseudonocardia acaciae]
MRFRFISGHVALDLAGTVGHRHAEDRYDLLTDPEALARWALEAGLVDTAPPAEARDLAATVALREAIYRLVMASIQREPADPGDVELVNAAAENAPVAVTLRGPGELVRTGDLRAVRATVARAAIELLGGPARGQLKRCGASPCSRLYLDASRRGSRRWCDMRECGNRAKAAAYRRRHATA